jgi:hypothetical protein
MTATNLLDISNASLAHIPWVYLRHQHHLVPPPRPPPACPSYGEYPESPGTAGNLQRTRHRVRPHHPTAFELAPTFCVSYDRYLDGCHDDLSVCGGRAPASLDMGSPYYGGARLIGISADDLRDAPFMYLLTTS